MEGLSFEGVTLLISGLLSKKRAEISCAWGARQQGIIQMSLRIWSYFLIPLKLALYTLRSEEENTKKKVCVKQRVFHESNGFFFSFWLFGYHSEV